MALRHGIFFRGHRGFVERRAAARCPLTFLKEGVTVPIRDADYIIQNSAVGKENSALGSTRHTAKEQCGNSKSKT